MIQAPPPPMTAFLTRPDIHGDRVVFTAEGDLWIGDVKGRSARRLTRDAGVETNAEFSPDGRTLAFTGTYEGGKDVYVMPVDGGEPRRLTYGANPEVQGWSPDGKTVHYRSPLESPVGFTYRLWSVPAGGGLPVPVKTLPRIEMGDIGATGDLVYVPVSNEWANWFRYEGGAADDLWWTDLKGKFRRLTTGKGIETTPVWCGKDVYFVSEATGSMNLWRLNPESGAQTPITKNVANPVRYPGSDGKRVVFQAGPTIALYDPASKATVPLRFTLNEDRIHGLPRRLPIDSAVTEFVPGPTGKRIAVIARGQVLTVPAEEGDLRSVENVPGARASLPAWSPDAKSIAFVSDRSGENEVWLAPADGGSARRLTTGLRSNPLRLLWSKDSKRLALQDRAGRTIAIDAIAGGFEVVDTAPYTNSYDGMGQTLTFSPDGALLAFSYATRSYGMGVAVVDLKSKSRYEVGPEGIMCWSPSFSPDGRHLAMLSARSAKPKSTLADYMGYPVFAKPVRMTVVALDPLAKDPFPRKVDEEAAPGTKEPEKKPETLPAPNLRDLPNRLLDAPVPSGEWAAMAWLDGRILLQSVDGEQETLSSFDPEDRKLSELATDVTEFIPTADGKRVLLNSGGKPLFLDLAPGARPKPVPLIGTVTVDPTREWNQIFDEAWRIARDFFYDPGMHGVDWNEVRARYRAQLPLVADRSDLERLLKDMVSELRTGHAYVGGGTDGGRPAIPVATLGADLEATPEGALRVARILRGDDYDLILSPLRTPGNEVREGDVILAIDGIPISAAGDFRAALLGKAGRTISLLVNGGAGDAGRRTVRIRPLSPSQDTELRLQAWRRSRAEYVRKKAGPTFGYFHVRDMVEGGVTDAAKAIRPNLEKDAVVVDLRYNSGGNVSTLLTWLWAQKPFAWFQPRDGGVWTREGWAFPGHLAAVINEDNFSDGELVVNTWQRLKIGPVVGKRTGGGEVGSGGGYAMIDGSRVFIPNYAAFDERGWLIEGTGAIPDVEVDQDPARVIAGEDPQLDKAIALLKEKLAKEPIRRPSRPPFPKKN